MTTRTNSSASRGPIYVLEDDRPNRLSPAADFEQAPFRSHAAPPLLRCRPRLIDDAEGWAIWRTERLELEQALAAHVSGRSLDAETADELREQLNEVERRVCDFRSSEILSEISSLQRKVRANFDNPEN